MSDQPQDAASETRPDTPPESPSETRPDVLLSVAEAATRLGVTQDAVRKRLQRGSLPGIKVGQSWEVIETEELKQATTSPASPPHDTSSGPPDTVPVAPDTTLLEELRSEVAARDNVIEDLRHRLDWAQANVDAKDRMLADVLADLARQRERTDVLQAQYQQATQKIHQLESGELPVEPSDDPGDEEAPQEDVGGVAGWWRRLWGL